MPLMLNAVEYSRLETEALELERILAGVKKWPWVRIHYPPQPRPRELPAAMAQVLTRGGTLVNSIMSRLFSPMELVGASDRERDLIACGTKVLALLKLAGVIPYR